MKLFTLYHSPIGILAVEQEDNIVIALHLEGSEFVQTTTDSVRNDQDPLLKEVVAQLEEYFRGERIIFNFPFESEGTEFQSDVWGILEQIPYGETRSYLEVATAIQKPKAVRAVGQANRRNPLPIIVPCHRVVGKNNSLTGYAGNQVDKKEYLLNLERKVLAKYKLV
ncbi:methylated-DNA--[protein]-cysteine S-methyltransferase [Mangrovibacillus cuniculi]|uniref:Methylated-DNA--protein-cysteine methyltransferase n=1 Tax=Mangrovibacillus cuniculi TaxID=2593652 RepID=A0A7S8HF40_9BACI|nr:methylated-DNA--[protein]-cysteine S-methyltransferase [Mangrovibacillus cuniculi]QPC46131.1 methylated-DNA--[protein]-cysteine S-methyltransferase [Mangrovibacillus cuniculi]